MKLTKATRRFLAECGRKGAAARKPWTDAQKDAARDRLLLRIAAGKMNCGPKFQKPTTEPK